MFVIIYNKNVMNLYLINHTYKYETEKICRIFYPAEKIVFCEYEPQDGEISSPCVITKVDAGEKENRFFCRAVIGEKDEKNVTFAPVPDENEAKTVNERELARCLLPVLQNITGIVPGWGILTGVRPSKLMRRHIELSGEEEAQRYFGEYLLVSPQKAELAKNVALAEEKICSLSQNNSFSLYVSIPFCPTRCSYCSFVSHSVASAKKLIPDYVRLLCEEIRLSGEVSKTLGLRIESVYFGGGTPTSLDAESLEMLTDAVRESFSLAECREYTVEAGRPDTITEEKLRVLKKAGVDRISINPQSFDDEVLKKAGRCHTSADTLEKFRLARKTGFDNINMDFIAGLPGDTPEGFKKSIDTALSLSPENITVHTLALKSASDMVTGQNTADICTATSAMVDYSRGALYENGYFPYYMYRQSKSVGNLENVGWSKPGSECLYNVFMMEEIHSIIACGGGAVTKIVSPDGNIERIYNFKYPYEYISRFDEIRARKKLMAQKL